MEAKLQAVKRIPFHLNEVLKRTTHQFQFVPESSIKNIH
jgi:hypothetical protein